MLNPMDLSGRLILVTGASSGIGRATSIFLSQLGARLVLVARNAGRLEQTVASLEGIGHVIELFDLTAIDDIAPWLKALTAKTGALDGLVHSAGVQSSLPIRFLDAAELDRVMRINFMAAVTLVRGFCQRNVYNLGGSIVLISSVMGLVGQPARSAYAGSKGALIALTKSAAMELARKSIRVNCVIPAYVKTEMADELHSSLTPEQIVEIESMHPLGIGTPQDVAYAIAFLLAKTAQWITGTSLVVDGGYTAH